MRDCDGTCSLCRAAEETSRAIPLYIAAGNTPGKTACPARAAFLPSTPAIIACGRAGDATSGIGTVYGTGFTEPIPFLTAEPRK
jgi:hypothetical protein